MFQKLSVNCIIVFLSYSSFNASLIVSQIQQVRVEYWTAVWNNGIHSSPRQACGRPLSLQSTTYSIGIEFFSLTTPVLEVTYQGPDTNFELVMSLPYTSIACLCQFSYLTGTHGLQVPIKATGLGEDLCSEGK